MIGTGAGFENSDVLQPKLKYKFRVLVQDFEQVQDLTTITERSNCWPFINYGESLSIYSTLHTLLVSTRVTLELVVRDEVNNNIASLVGIQIQKQQTINQTLLAGNEYKFKCKMVRRCRYPRDMYVRLFLNVNYDRGDYAANDPLNYND